MQPKQIISSKLTILAFVALLVFLGSLKFKQWQSQQAINKLKSDLEQQAASEGKKNQELNQSISYLNSSSFKDKVARGQLNLKKDGEQVYNFSENNIQTTAPDAAPLQNLSNSQKWWQYFFSPNE